ncbi:Concanavalin A-like lectin/glucanase [Cordyceps fumosorosea ARSEF 2679]|uniref:Concanavalin A-like lectin/glucanase n=1 Tax=Cordyceps fumosorosea (strain ARSEF 2679) TaxID=1081104 RepID=A0A168DGR1_CORFA|nr:Concanavalin A-like lectin/glucanase [Cordyceps fumosorosea ARSEF 2679]OAA72598.1 Concanavalin A-like lectin/glucanase [Cordyceps fumosorosea ARSEF 2679]
MPGYEDEGDLMPSHHHGKASRAVTKMPWWNPRYWTRKVWIAVVVVFVIIAVVIGVAVGVTVSKNNAYPSYKPLSYALQDTCKYSPEFALCAQSNSHVADSGEDFFDQFNYFNTYDPAHGFVHYVSPADAKQHNLTYATQSSAIIRVDTTVGPGSNPDASTGRFSVRIESKKTYDKGLFVFDVRHTPYACAAWPALWLTDPSHWPEHGEIDVLEAINLGASGNAMTLHSDKGCSMGGKREMTGKALDKSCYVKDNSNAGCGVQGPAGSFGAALNDKQGAVVAVEWRADGIRMWQFARDGVPADVQAKKPTPEAWGTAAADFPNTHCDIGARFSNHSIVANIDLCGDLVEASWKDSGCGGGAKCTDFVATKPSEFTNAYWEFGAFEVYQAS